MELRPYQREAVDAVYRYLREHDDNPCAVLPTAAGKTPVLATICRDAVGLWNGRVLVLAHVKELLEQTAGTLQRMAPDLPVGIYSAGLGRRDLGYAVTVAGIQSIYKRAADLPPVDLVIVDEAHLIPPDGDGMYRQFLAEAKTLNPHLRTVGLTATPFRMSTGSICTPDGFLNAICYEISVRELIVQGYLCPLRTKAGSEKADWSALHVRAGEYIAGEVEAMMDADRLVESACAEIVEHARQRKSVLIFASGIQHGLHVQRVIQEDHGARCGFVCGDTPDGERDRMLREFRKGRLTYLTNVNVLTTGFDAPNIDCVAMLRPTMSPGLFYQMCLDMHTEVLTPTGWARCGDVEVGDTVGAFDMDSGRIVWCKAAGKVHRPLAAGESMYGVQSPHLDIRVTDRHTMVYKGRSPTSRNWCKADAQDLARHKDSFHIPITGNNDGRGLSLSDDEVRFLGWALTDGHRNPHNNAVIICQSSASPHNTAIISMLDGCSLGYRVYRIKRKGNVASYPDAIQYVIPHGRPRGVNKGKRGWQHLSQFFDNPVADSMEDISQRQLEVMLEAMNLADGSKRRNQSWQQRTMHIAIGPHAFLADQLQSLLIRRGFRCNISHQRQRSPWNPSEPKPLHILHVRRQTTATVGGTNHRPSRMVKNRCSLKPMPFTPGEMVWCLTTEHGTLVTRRSGKVAILGNCGRGFRLAPGKADCMILDFGGNVLRHGPVDALRVIEPGEGTGEPPAKECPECHAVIASGYGVCPECGHEFPPRMSREHEAKASDAAILSGQVTLTKYAVSEVSYAVHTKRDAPPDAPKTMRVQYRIGFSQWRSEWICFEHTGWPRAKAESWWRQRSDEPVPDTAAEAVTAGNLGRLAEPVAITVKSVAGEKYDQIVGYRFADEPPPDAPFAPEPAAACADDLDLDDGSVPF